MRILIGTDTYPPTVNGAGRFTQRLVRGLAARGHTVHLACPSATGRPGIGWDPSGAVVHRVRSFRYAGYRDFPVAMPGVCRSAACQILNTARPDVLHVQSGFLLGGALVAEARARGIRIVATNHLMPANVLDHLPVPAPLRPAASKLLWGGVRRVYRRADAVTSPTPTAAELMYANTGIEGLAVSNGIDLDRYRRAGEPVGRTPVILFVGRLDPEKHLEDAVRAMAALPADVPGRLEVVGDGSARSEWEALAGSLHLGADRVRFLGRLSDRELMAAYRRAAILCMPGTAELQSLVTLEAIATGMPVVAADAMALPHLVHDDDNGYLFRPRDSRQLAGRLATLLQHPRLRRQMAAAGLRIVEPHGFQATLATFEDLYRHAGRPALLPGRPQPVAGPAEVPVLAA